MSTTRLNPDASPYQIAKQRPLRVLGPNGRHQVACVLCNLQRQSIDCAELLANSGPLTKQLQIEQPHLLNDLTLEKLKELKTLEEKLISPPILAAPRRKGSF